MKQYLFAAAYVVACVVMCVIALAVIGLSLAMELPAAETLIVIVMSICVFTYFLCKALR